MRRMLGVLAMTALVGIASAASAAEITGPIENLDQAAHKFTVGGTVFTASPSNTVGAKLADPKKGDRVTVFYEANASDRQPWNVLVLRKSR